MSKNKEETPLSNLSKIYPKLCKKNQTPIFKQFQEIVKFNLDEDTQMVTLHLWEETS